MFAMQYSIHRIDMWLVDIAMGKLNSVRSPAQVLNVYAWLVKGFVTSTLDSYYIVIEPEIYKMYL